MKQDVCTRVQCLSETVSATVFTFDLFAVVCCDLGVPFTFFWTLLYKYLRFTLFVKLL